MRLYFDIETFSTCDLRACGLYRYAADASTQVLLVYYAIDDGPVVGWSPVEGEPLPADFAAAWTDETCVLVAHNAAFERVVLGQWARRTGLLPGRMPALRRWYCTMAHASTLALPASLDALGDVLGLDEGARKLKAAGTRLINKFSVPQAPTKKRPAGGQMMPAEAPTEWAEFREYCQRDVVTTREIFRTLSQWPMLKSERALYVLDQQINDVGIPIDLDLVQAALDVDKRERSALMQRAVELTGLENPNSREQMLGWLQQRGVEVDNLRSRTVGDLVASDLPPGDAREVVEIRSELAKSSVKKFDVLRDATAEDGRIRGCLQFCGAGRTGRWAGRMLQPQNLPSGNVKDPAVAAMAIKSRDNDLIRLVFGSVANTLSSAVRPAIAAPAGKALVAVDYASIETVMLAWAAGCTRLLTLIRGGGDPYKDFASQLYGIPYSAVTKAQRKFAKPPMLGCGYYLGARGLVAYADAMGVQMTEADAQRSVTTYRETYHEIPTWWRQLDRAMRLAILQGNASAGRFTFTMRGPFLMLGLPSGRSLAYYSPKVVDLSDGRTAVTYLGVDSRTRQWGRIETHPGKIAENIIQAISRDILAAGLVNATKAGFEIVMHVHDEIVALVDENDGAALQRLKAQMTAPVEWCADAPISAAGWMGREYRKD